MNSDRQFDYDVFLCHNTKDKDEVKAIGKDLKEYGLKPWLDEWAIRLYRKLSLHRLAHN